MRSDIEVSRHKPLTHMCFQERGQAAKNLSIRLSVKAWTLKGRFDEAEIAAKFGL